MPWVFFDDRYPYNRKIRKLSDAAYRLDNSAIFWCNIELTDGFIGEDDLPLVSDVRNPKRVAKELVDKGRWESVDGGWRIHDYFDYNKHASRIRAERDAKSQRQQRWRQGLRDTLRDTDVDASQDESPSPGSSYRDGNGTANGRPLDDRFTDVTGRYEEADGFSEGGLSCDEPVADKLSRSGARPGQGSASVHVDASTDTSHDAPTDAAPARAFPHPSPPLSTTTSPSSAHAEGDTPPPRRKPKRPAPADGFGVFWDAYPRKVAKAAAEKAYARALADGADRALILAGAEFYALERKLQDPRFTKHPATWLNGRCWEDEPDPDYRPPVIGAASVAAAALPPPIAETLGRQRGYGGPLRPPEPVDEPPWPQIGMNLDG